MLQIFEAGFCPQGYWFRAVTEAGPVGSLFLLLHVAAWIGGVLGLPVNHTAQTDVH